ncbi:MAG: hypothetical protein KC502_02470 [Myxococcales bacterium]|nr:hypothetical protein [Myxococcales bacterium]
MLTGLQHAHKYLGYLTFLMAVLGLIVALAGAAKDSKKAGILDKIHRHAFMHCGRLSVVLGLALLFMKYGTDGAFATWGWWVGLVAWGGIEPISKRMVNAEIAAVQGGGQGSSKLIIGTVLEVVILTAVVGIMTMARLGKL